MFKITKKYQNCPSYNETAKIILSLQFLLSPVWWQCVQSVCSCCRYVCPACLTNNYTDIIV